MPTNLTTTIAKLDTCPNVTIVNNTNYPAGTSHAITNFNRYAKATMQLPNNTSVVFNPYQYPNPVNTPSQSGIGGVALDYNTCLVGRFYVDYVALPTPPEEEVDGQSPLYYAGDNFYYDGVIYNVIGASLSLPAEGFTNTELIETYLADNSIEVIEESEINSKYKAYAIFAHFCNVTKCLVDKLSKINCLIVKEPTRTDICEMALYDEILNLNYIEYLVNNVLNYQNSEEVNYQVESISNYVNSLCCCGKQKCC